VFFVDGSLLMGAIMWNFSFNKFSGDMVWLSKGFQ